MDFELFDAAILCDGDYPFAPIPLGVLSSAGYVCCCDRAAVAYIGRGNNPDAIVGDGDSLPDDFKRRYSDILHIEHEQEYNDQTKATRHCMQLGHRRIAYLGATGKREDHTIGNVSLLLYYSKELGADPVMFTDYGFFMPVSGTRTFKTFPNQQVSIFNFSCHKIKSTGLRWDTYAFESWWQGTLNEAVGDSITLETDGDAVVYFTYKAKGDD